MARWAEAAGAGRMIVRVDPASSVDCDASEGFLQSGFWGAFKADFGWRPSHYTVRSGELCAALLVLERNLGSGLSFAYIPHGPALDVPEEERGDFLAALSEALRARLARGCLFIRYDPPWYLTEASAATVADGVASGRGSARAPVARPAVGAPLRRAAADVQPPDTVLLDLERAEEDILAGMKPKWRYNIRLAEKKGVVVEDRGPGALGEFYRLYEATARRDRIALHPLRYYERLFSLASEYPLAEGGLKPDLRLWVASHEGEALAAIVALYRGRRAVYLYGASSDAKRNLMPAYALQWAAIRAAKAAGCAEYDLYGIPPTDESAHAMAGLYRFKTGFGGSIVHRSGSWDYPLKPLLYDAFRAAEAARTWYFKDFRKRTKKGGTE